MKKVLTEGTKINYTNKKLQNEAKELQSKKLYNWQIAQKLGITESQLETLFYVIENCRG